MAELTNNSGQNSGRVKRSKQVPRVDLTAMVDLAFLLITFFMLTTTLAKSNALDIAMPVDGPPGPVSETRTMTICLGKDNKVQWYRGTIDKPIVSPITDNYGKNGIRKVLLEQSQHVVKATGDLKKGLIVIIKPSDKSNYKNLVDIVDEMQIARVASYAIVDIAKEDLDIMKNAKIY